ncbi:MAG: disulfide oxidoreductase [Candidatus Levybacteria bacterium CG_4_9_14_3_um_filter_35_16]|nr:MAG: disulfide oxidoreductase [Candidatus Levybacteria bacterium CG22_combo_CG10-13_8_21_14_all_35_11]PIY94469.1 MAG: disulfide oxidoreductase [Candidatus Levybacteria bacterium CG_4_10_14_0_8_um_filter_35_23]PIZ98420.1 MAG: disulfide oxidoreductase [Candidatus Levybacteria bacterium CG_4_10_14_0_2_um_filter_35_8]PJA91574.1 MAG: disulfide oxidoreductase [Candidatus Levybacteria bacterium CG_4_9_14_3_um_filter_35_16]PJC54598.1 MAG: disulfide oxidoreductase [Candidatus Levybacteria bacterium C
MVKKIVKKGDLIGEVIKNFPESAIVMLSHGLNCVGCHANELETIEEGAAVHGLINEEIKQMINEINQIINKN